LLPAPSRKKVKTGGDDTFFICHSEKIVGMADGVGGWADVGVDTGKYARELMSHNQ
jgi:protein phosphatase PTC7